LRDSLILMLRTWQNHDITI